MKGSDAIDQEQIKRYGLIGYPVSHSMSPAVFGAAFAAAGIKARYDLFPVHPDDLEHAVAGLVDDGLQGFNVTVPHKTSIMPLISKMDESAVITGAVNTVRVVQDGLEGHNTDMSGFGDSFGYLGVGDIAGAEVLVLGAGGAARAVVACLCQKGASKIIIANIYIEEISDLLSALAPSFPSTEFDAVPLDSSELGPISAGVVLCVQATSLGLGSDDPLPADPAVLPEGCFVYDLVYGTGPTPFVKAALDHGHRAADGKEMLLRQAVKNYSLWIGGEAPIEAMREGLKQEMRKREEAKSG